MTKFTKALTREIEVGGERLAVTLDENGLSIRSVGSRRPPLDLTWAGLVATHSGKPAATPSDKELAAALTTLRGGAAAVKAAPPKLSDVLTQLDAYLTKNRPGYHKGLQPGASATDLAKLEKSLGVALPEDLRAWFEWHNGQSQKMVGCFVESWLMLSAEEIAACHKEQKAEADELWNDAFVPILDDNQGDLVVIDTRHGSRVVELWRGHDKPEIVAESLTAWAAELVSDFEAGLYVEDSERGEFLRTSDQ